MRDLTAPGIFENVNGKLMIGGKFAFYMFQTHGIPPEYLEDIMYVLLRKKGNMKQLLKEIKHQNDDHNGK